MVGEISERDYYSVRDNYKSDQSSLLDWSDDDETLVAVVSRPGDTGIDDMCDEWYPELGVPDDTLVSFWETRTGYRTNSAVEHPHDKAYDDCEIDSRYYEYVERSTEAQERVAEIIDRADAGEDIVLVCFEKEGQQCHRHTLLDIIEEQRAKRFTLSS